MDFLTNPADPTGQNPLAKFIMPTVAQQVAQQPPQQQQQAQTNPQTQALIDALRNGTGAGNAPASGGRVQSAGYFGQGMNTNAIGNALKPLFSSSGGGIGGISGGSTF
jgi:hypothetical protein